MGDTSAEKMIVDGLTFNASTDYMYTKPKPNASGGKSIGILNTTSKKGLYISTPLMLTWGVNDFTDEKSGRKTYDMCLQFPKEEYNSETVAKFLENMKAFEAKLKADAIKNCKEWMNKAKMSSEVIDALWTPMLKYPKDQESGEFDYSRPPTLRLKIPTWEGEWKIELYDMDQNSLFPNENSLAPPDLISKASQVATVMQCGGLWFANGKFGVTWRLVQAVVKPKQTMKGQCFINLSVEDKATLKKSGSDDDNEVEVQVVASSDDEDEEDEVPSVVAATVAMEVAEAVEEAAPPPKKKVVRKKKLAD
jgi:hypothetical protein